MVRPFDLEPSTIRAFSVDGSPLDIEPSMISTSSVEGSVDLYRTIRDMALQHGRFAAHPALRQCQEPEWYLISQDLPPSALEGPKRSLGGPGPEK